MRPPTESERVSPVPHAAVVVIGGANVDVKCRIHGRTVAHTSNPGRTTTAPGGVGRNVAENLARLGVNVALVSAVGDDAHASYLLDATRHVGVDVGATLHVPDATGTYTAVLAADGELVIAVAAMSAMDGVTPDAIRERHSLIERARLLVLDCNIAEPALATALEIARDAGVRVIVDPVSVPKAARLRAVADASRPIFTVTPNREELAALTGLGTANDAEHFAALHARGVENVWLRLGAHGSTLSARGSSGDEDRVPALDSAVVDVTGAGDAMLAGFAYALLNDLPLDVAVRYGHAAAALTVASSRTVSDRMTADTLRHAVGEMHTVPSHAP